jgi:FecR-like protein
MSRRIKFVLVSALIAATLSCGTPGGGGSGTAPATTAGPGGALVTPSAGGSTGTGTRSANISEIQNTVEAQNSGNAPWQAAADGQQIGAGGGVKTGDASRARLDIAPDTTVVRVAPNTEFTVEAISPAPTDPVTRIVLAAGKLFAQVTKKLGGGSFEVETPSGVATVRGSLLGTTYERASGLMVATCLEGQCRLSQPGPGGAFTDLIAGQASEIAGPGKAPSPARLMTVAELTTWATEFPATAPIVARLKLALPTPTPTSGVGGGLTACDHPYFPLRAGATWTYSTSSGSTTWTVNSVTGDAQNASAELSFQFSGGQVTWHFQCTASGIASYDFGAISTSAFGQFAVINIQSSSGVFLPVADLLAPGYSWSNSAQMEIAITAPGQTQQFTGTQNRSENLSVTGAAPVEVGGQQFEGLQISFNNTSSLQFQIQGYQTPATTTESSGTWVLARGVGVVKSTSSAAGQTETSDLTSYSIP